MSLFLFCILLHSVAITTQSMELEVDAKQKLFMQYQNKHGKPITCEEEMKDAFKTLSILSKMNSTEFSHWQGFFEELFGKIIQYQEKKLDNLRIKVLQREQNLEKASHESDRAIYFKRIADSEKKSKISKKCLVS